MVYHADHADHADRLDEFPPESPWVLTGRPLRLLLSYHLLVRSEATVAELTDLLATDGFLVVGRPSKTISDALRWEVSAGRARRLERGRYRFGTAPPTTRRRIRLFGERCRSWADASAAGGRPVPAPPDRRSPRWRAERPETRPWSDLGWLWAA